MSNLALKNKDDYPDAAKKHLVDAQKLLDVSRFDGAVYLAGYVIECALRTVVIMGHVKKLADENAAATKSPIPRLSSLLGMGNVSTHWRKAGESVARELGKDHDLVALAKATTGYKDVLSAGTVCYVPAIDSKKLPFKDLNKMTDMRYRAEGVMSADDAKTWVDEAAKCHDASVGRMKLDGVLK